MQTIDKCDLCGNNMLEKLYDTVDIAHFQAHKVELFICIKCGLVFQKKIPWDNIKDYYASHYHFVAEEYTEIVKEQTSFIFGLIPFDKKKTRVLDIGCADGSFLEGLEPHIDKGGIFGCELSRPFIEVAKDKKGFFIYEGLFEQIDFDASFDLVTMRYILEHTISPTSVMLKINNILKTAGKLFIEVPDIYKHLFGEFNDYNCEHYYYFSIRTLEMFLSKAGFSIIKIEQKPGHIKGTGMEAPYIRVLAQKESSRRPFQVRSDYGNIKMLFKSNAWKFKETVANVNKKLERFIKGKNSIVIFSAGRVSGSLFYLTDLSKCNITCFIDNNTMIHKKPCFGKEVLPPREIVQLPVEYVIFPYPPYYEVFTNQLNGLYKKVANCRKPEYVYLF